MVTMLFHSITAKQDIFDIGGITNFKVITENVIHEVLERSHGVGKTERHDQELVQSEALAKMFPLFLPSAMRTWL